MRCTCSRVAPLLLLAACVTAPAPSHPRPALPLPAEIAAEYALPAPPVLIALQADAAARTFSGVLGAGDERAAFHLVRPAGAPKPLVVIVPILAGGDLIMQALAERMLQRGYAAAWCERAGPALRPPQRGADLEHLFRRTVVHQRMLLAWARTSRLVVPDEQYVLGVSMGGMVATVVAAVEPSLTGTAICLAGGDLPDLVVRSREGRVMEWREWRRDVDGAGSWEIEQELRRALHSDPLRLAPFVATGRVLMVSAAFDDVVPAHNSMLLWEALGRPRELTVPLGHYSAALALNPILDAVGDFFAAAPPPPTDLAEPGGLPGLARR